MQGDWVELPDPPAHWDAGREAHLLVGALPHSGRWRGVLAESEDQPHLIEAMHAVSAQLGGLPRQWRFDRIATVASPNTGRVSASFAAVAKHYGVHVDLCPPRHGHRKGTVEKANHSAAQRWWRTLADELTPAQAQVSLDRFCARIGDRRVQRRDGERITVGALAAAEALAALPPAFPATVAVERIVTAQALVAFRGNTYSVPPRLGGARASVSHRRTAPVLDPVLTPPRTRALIDMVRATGALHAGNLDQAVATARAAIELSGSLRSSRWRSYVREVLRATADVHGKDARVVDLTSFVAEQFKPAPKIS